MPPTASALAFAGALLLTEIPVAVAFPNSQNPFAGGPPVEIPSEASCTVTLFDHEALALYGAVSTAPYAGPPPGCPGPWAKVGLGFTGSVAGVQYDRAGALWLGGVELLRTTTPEPDAPGISWVVDRDLTAYSALFYEASNATLQIPNTVNDQYTGVLYITARLVFFPLTAGSDDEAAKAAWADAVIPLAPPPANSNPWGSMAIAGATAKTLPLQFPRVDVTEVFLDLYASGHGCEEFWYSNVPGEWAGPLGICGACVQDILSHFSRSLPFGDIVHHYQPCFDHACCTHVVLSRWGLVPPDRGLHRRACRGDPLPVSGRVHGGREPAPVAAADGHLLVQHPSVRV